MKQSLHNLFNRLNNVFSPQTLQNQKIKSISYIFIDDGSKDNSSNIIREYIKKVSCKTLSFL